MIRRGLVIAVVALGIGFSPGIGWT